MGRRAARATHLALSVLGAALYFLFVIPRWWVLTGDIPDTLATVGRIAAGLPVAAAAVPVALALRQSLKTTTPEVALRLRAWSAVLHVVAGILMIVTAVAEIWLGLGAAGPWLFGVYGAAGAIAALAILAFVLSFTAEKPPAPAKPKPAGKKSGEKKGRTLRRRNRKGAASTDEDASAPRESDDESDGGSDGGSEGESPEGSGDESADDTQDTAERATTHDAANDAANDAGETPEPDEAAALRNRRPTGKRRRLLGR